MSEGTGLPRHGDAGEDGSEPTDAREVLGAIAPFAMAIGVFGIVYGALAAPQIGAPMTVASSVIVFSGAAQFAMIGLLTAGAGSVAIATVVAILGLRHLLLGALLRPCVRGGRVSRAAQSYFMIDETAGVALTARDATRALVIGGIVCSAAWVCGTLAGAALGSLTVLEGLAEALGPVLFVALAGMMARDRVDLVRSAIAAAMALTVALVWPGARGLAPIVIAVLVALPDPGRPEPRDSEREEPDPGTQATDGEVEA